MRKPQNEGFQDSDHGPKGLICESLSCHELGLIESVEISAENSVSEFVVDSGRPEELIELFLSGPRQFGPEAFRIRGHGMFSDLLSKHPSRYCLVDKDGNFEMLLIRKGIIWENAPGGSPGAQAPINL